MYLMMKLFGYNILSQRSRNEARRTYIIEIPLCIKRYEVKLLFDDTARI